jgi:putative phage-type endonuclease
MSDDNIIYQNGLDIKKLKKIPDLDIDKIKDRIKVIKKYQKQLEILKALPVITQKTPEWFKARESMISASDFAQALNEGKFGTQKQLIMKKVNPIDDFKSNPFFAFGNMFEPVASSVYSVMHNNIKIHDFGLIKHNKLDFFGASPDGITELGIMLEIKCPMKRKISMGDEVPLQYYYQVQGQLEVCNLNECDYFECEFTMYKNYDEFLTDNENIRGLIIKKNNIFEYSPVYNKCSVDDWLTDKEYDELRCWKVTNYNLKRIIKDPVFLKEKLEGLKKVWDNICRYKNNSNDYTLEVLKTIEINTECLLETKQINGYMFKD